MKENNVWDLSVFYKDEESFLADLATFKSLIPEVKAFEGKIKTGEGVEGCRTVDK